MLKLLWIYFYLLAACSSLIHSSRFVEVVRRGPADERACDSRLMDAQARLPDTAFSSSSVRQNLEEFRPYRARLGSLYAGKDHSSGQAWCPNSTVQTAMNEWIQVEFPQLNIIRTIFTTGRGDGYVAEYMPYFILHYQREYDGPWYEHTTRDSQRVIQGNIDPRNTARHTFDPTVIARRIRIYPFSAKSQHLVCLRFALKGCPFPDGITEYEASEGSRGPLGTDRYQHIDFRDLTNDASRALGSDGNPGGLGKLVDNVAFLGNLTQDVYESPKNHHFVGWKRSGVSPVQLTFKFDQLRNFSRLLLFTYESAALRVGLANHTNVNFIKGRREVGVSEETQVTFPLSDASDKVEEVNGGSWRSAGDGNRATVFRNPVWDGAVVVSIPLQGHLAQEISLELFHSNDWLLLSEVQFISEPQDPTEKPTHPKESETGGHVDVDHHHQLQSPEARPFLYDAVTMGTTVSTVSAIDAVSLGAPEGSLHSGNPDDPSAGNGGSINNGGSSHFPVSTVTHRQGLAKDQLRANSRGTTFIIVIVVSLLLSVFCVILVLSLCIRMQQSRHRHHSSLKKSGLSGGNGSQTAQTQSPPPPPPPLPPTQTSGQHPMQPYQAMHQTNMISMCSNLMTTSGPVTASPGGYLFTNGTGALYTGNGAPPPPPPPLQVLPSTAMFSTGPDACHNGLPSPGHNFATLGGGDLASRQQFALQQYPQSQQQFYPPMGMIHQVTAGDTTTDSGSLYTTPPALCPVMVGNHHPHLPGVMRNGDKASRSVSNSSGDDADEREEKNEGLSDDEGGGDPRIRRKDGPPVARAERSSVTASSASESAQRTEEGMNGIDTDALEGRENTALLRPVLSNTSGRKQRRSCNANKRRRQRTQQEMPESLQNGGFPQTTNNPILQSYLQAYPADMAGTEYASASLFGSSTTSNNGVGSSTMKRGSASLLGGGGGGGGGPYPSTFLTTGNFEDQGGSNVNPSSFHLYHPILVPAQQAHLFQNAMAAAAAAAAVSGGYGDSQQPMGGLVQSSPFLSQGILHSGVPHTTGYPTETPLIVSTTAAAAASNGWTNGGALKSSSGTPLPPVPNLPLPPNPHLNNHLQHQHQNSANDGASSSRLSIYSVCM